MRVFKSFYKTVEGTEGNHCQYPTRLDTYGCGCEHDCKYCYAKTLLDFRGLWNAKDPAVADVLEIEKVVKKIPKGTIIRLGGMTDCFQAIERKYRVTLETIKLLNKYNIGYLIVTKSDLVAEEEYTKVMRKDLAHIQITVTCLDDELYKKLDYEKAPLPSRRIQAIEKLQELGFDIQLRLSPCIEEFIDFDKLNAVKCDKILVEFLRVNGWIKRWFKLDYRRYKLKANGYRHLPLKEKIRILEKITGFKERTVCEDFHNHWRYWKLAVNNNQKDCCNLRS